MKGNAIKSILVALTFLITIGFTGCGKSLEEGRCTNKIEFEYSATLGWFQEVTDNAASYDTYEDYLSAYREPLERWQTLEPKTTCDAALIDLMIKYLTLHPEDEQYEEVFDEIGFFDFDIAHTGR